MSKSYKIAFGLFLFLVLSLTWLESTEPEPINWNPSYTSLDKIPLGAYIFFETWNGTKTNKIKEIKIPPYEYLNETTSTGCYFFLNDRVNFDEDELNDLLAWVSKGNKLFISTYNFGENLEDTLNFRLSSFISKKGFTSRPALNLVNPALELKQDAKFDHDLPAIYFGKIDTLNHTVLGEMKFEANTEEKINFLKIEFGEGDIFLHSTPQAFSNYFLLKEDNYRYSENLLAYLKNENILWDAYYKSGKSFYTSPLYILLNNRPLKWAYYFVIIAAILFILFEGKRKQRAIPVVKPLENKSFEYTETVSQLYIEQKKYHELGLKKIALFMEYIRLNYRLDPNNRDEEFLKNLASKSENTYSETKELFQRIFNFQQDKKNTKEAFLELSNLLNSFKKNGKTRRKP